MDCDRLFDRISCLSVARDASYSLPSLMGCAWMVAGLGKPIMRRFPMAGYFLTSRATRRWSCDQISIVG